MNAAARMMLLANRKSGNRDNGNGNRGNGQNRRDYGRNAYDNGYDNWERENTPENRYGGERMADRGDYRRYDRSRGGRIYNGGYDDGYEDMPYIGNAFIDRRGRRHYDDGRYAPMDAMEYADAAPTQYPYRGYGMYNRYDSDREEPYRRNMMGFMHHKGGYEFEMDGRSGDMKGYAKGRVIPMRDESSKKWKNKENIEPLDEETAEEWLHNMKGEDGKKGEHFSMEQTKQLMKQYNWDVDPIDAQLTLNAMYTDYCAVARKFDVDNPEFYVCLSKAFLDDPDSKLQGAEKLAAYYEYVVK